MVSRNDSIFPHNQKNSCGEDSVKCWICGNDGKTGEHLSKASDLKSIFKGANQKNPLFFSTDLRRNSKIGSIKRSPRVKSNALICAHCNNVRTAPHDRAWEKLSNYLLKRKPPIKKGHRIKLNKVFPGAIKKSMLVFNCINNNYYKLY